jgi:hypothetical protein
MMSSVACMVAWWHGWRCDKTLASHRCGPMGRGFDPLVLHVSWVVCWFSPLPRGFFSGSSGFPPSVKINIPKFQFDLGMHVHVATSWALTLRVLYTLSVTWVNIIFCFCFCMVHRAPAKRWWYIWTIKVSLTVTEDDSSYVAWRTGMGLQSDCCEKDP